MNQFYKIKLNLKLPVAKSFEYKIVFVHPDHRLDVMKLNKSI